AEPAASAPVIWKRLQSFKKGRPSGRPFFRIFDKRTWLLADFLLGQHLTKIFGFIHLDSCLTCNPSP
ncbi:hypothetical protein, partial [Thalassospira sp. MCCC 1A01148]|uniref:hypothetical protein n=1 Tax=Thalassospira sp. MCCC 1A01148 TaxID=501834 RepID=UPI001E59F949